MADAGNPAAELYLGIPARRKCFKTPTKPEYHYFYHSSVTQFFVLFWVFFLAMKLFIPKLIEVIFFITIRL